VLECREVPRDREDEVAQEAHDAARYALHMGDFTPCEPLASDAPRVRVIEGPLHGMTGRVRADDLSSPGDTATLVLQVTQLRAAVSTRISRSSLMMVR
jgi:hypothetical protein